MSETTSSPSVNQHPISRSSSLSSTPPDSAPDSEPTSDEQPDLGAFTTVLREWTHLQPPPRIPIQIRSATSSTTPTYHAEQSVTGSEGRSRNGRSSNSRGTRSALSTLSSFTRPQSSSAHPDGSTVWAHAPIASYLFSGTPSLERSEEREEDREEAYTPSPPDSRASTALTVEIASETEYPSFDDDSVSSHPNRDDLSPDDTASAAIPIPVVGELESLRVDSRETEHTVDEIDSLSSQELLDNSSLTSRDVIRPISQDRVVISSQNSDISITSIQLQSQARPVTTTFHSTSSLSLPLSVASSDDPVVSISIAGPSSASQINSVIGPAGTSSDSNSTLMNEYLNRNRNPSIPRRMSDTSYTTNVSASSFSLVSYQLAETPSALAPHEEESDPDRFSDSQRWVQVENPSTSSSALSTCGIISLKTQPSLPSTSSSSLNSLNSMAPQGNISNLSLSSNESPLPNPHSHLSTPEYQVQALTTPPETARQISFSHRIGNDISIVDDSGTPDHEPSDMVLFSLPPSHRVFETVREDADGTGPGQPSVTNATTAAIQAYSPTLRVATSSSDQDNNPPEDISASIFGTKKPRAIQPYPSDESLDEDEIDHTYRYSYSHSHTPRHPFAHTPRGIPASSNPSSRLIQKATTTTLTSTASSSFLKHQSFIERQHETSAISAFNTMYSAIPSTNVPIVQSHEIDDNEITRSPPSPFLKLSNVDAAPDSPQQTSEPAPSINRSHVSQQSSSQLPYHYPSKVLQPNTLGLVPSSARPKTLHEELDSPISSTSQPISLQTQPYSTSSIVLEASLSGYPHSLTGLHLLPTEPPRAAVVLESSISSSSAYSHQTNETFEVNPPDDYVGHDVGPARYSVTSGLAVQDDNLELEEDMVFEGAEGGVLPSLGYLDEALSFIAAERARWTAAREVIPVGGSRGRSLGSRTDEDDDNDDIGDIGKDGEEDWRNAIADFFRPRERRRPTQTQTPKKETV
ncbi:hypothetical protein CPB83DRAFT_100563 [Crepidotus variabilis]|uniref:Uncharacterized protein n=1 Tax=Crepidotus variabilis TaxID=179855 RepID=A0A9P6EM24_9AGAR|nr:hypothetical protein CPB83DRAFT_100563 [Crepidotus variabilis]